MRVLNVMCGGVGMWLMVGRPHSVFDEGALMFVSRVGTTLNGSGLLVL